MNKRGVVNLKRRVDIVLEMNLELEMLGYHIDAALKELLKKKEMMLFTGEVLKT